MIASVLSPKPSRTHYLLSKNIPGGMMARVNPSSESYYTREHRHLSDSTPNSAVSSFNFPAPISKDLNTPPLRMTTTTSMAANSTPVTPASHSPQYQLFSAHEEYTPTYSNPPMKQKVPSSNGPLQITAAADSYSPVSPSAYPQPFYGSFSVSASSGPTNSPPPPRFHPSPAHPSAGGTSSTGSHDDSPRSKSNSSSAPYRVHNSPPVLIAPNPMTLRPAIKQEPGVHCRNSSSRSQRSPARKNSGGGNAIQARSRKSNKRRSDNNTLSADLLSSSGLNKEEALLLRLYAPGDLSWKALQEKFNRETGKEMTVAALQMRKKRLAERQRDKALLRAESEFERSKAAIIVGRMPQQQHRSHEKWTPEQAQRQLWEIHNSLHYPQAFTRLRASSDLSYDESAWSDNGRSGTNSPQQLCTMQQPPMANIDMHFPSQPPVMFQQQQQPAHAHYQHHHVARGWGPGP